MDGVYHLVFVASEATDDEEPYATATTGHTGDKCTNTAGADTTVMCKYAYVCMYVCCGANNVNT